MTRHFHSTGSLFSPAGVLRELFHSSRTLSYLPVVQVGGGFQSFPGAGFFHMIILMAFSCPYPPPLVNSGSGSALPGP